MSPTYVVTTDYVDVVRRRGSRAARIPKKGAEILRPPDSYKGPASTEKWARIRPHALPPLRGNPGGWEVDTGSYG